MLTVGGAGRAMSASGAMLGVTLMLVTGCSSGTPEPTDSPSPPASSPTLTPSPPAKIAVIPQKMPGEVARLEVRGDVVSNARVARAKPGVRYAAYAACSRPDPSDRFRYSVWLNGRRLMRTAVSCDGQQTINTALTEDEGGGRVRIKPHWTISVDEDKDVAAGMSMTAYVVVAPEPGATPR